MDDNLERPAGLEPIPTFEEFVAFCREEFAFVQDFGFQRIPLPTKQYINPFQVRFSNSKAVLVIEGRSYGQWALVDFENMAGVCVPDYLFAPEAKRPRHKRGDPPGGQFNANRAAAKRVQEFCGDLLVGDMTRFDEQAGELARKRDEGWKEFFRSGGVDKYRYNRDE